MFCRWCGKENPPGSKRCMYCGTSLEPQPQKNNRGWIIGIGVGVALLCIIILGVTLVMFRKPQPNQRKRSYAMPSPSAAITATPTPTHTPTPTPVPTQAPTQVPPPAQQVNPNAQQRALYLDMAQQIEDYTATYLDPAVYQQDINRESAVVFQKWDDLLNMVYQYLRMVMSEETFANLQAEELDWIARKEAAIEAAGAEWGDGTGAPMARNVTGIDYTKERCYYLISLIP